jgi:hypothetical protein
MATGEKNAAALGVDRLAGNIAPALHLRGGGGVASVGGRQGKGQRQQRNHACKRGGVLFLHAAMVQGGHEEWLKNVLDGAFNRPISLQPFGQWSLRAVCGVGPLVEGEGKNVLIHHRGERSSRLSLQPFARNTST